MRVDLDPIVSAFVQQNSTPGGTNPGRFSFGVTSMITDGGGTWTIVCEEPFIEDEVEMTLTPGPGSNAGGQGISFGVASWSTPGTISIITYRNDTGAAVAVPFFLSIKRRRQYAWD